MIARILVSLGFPVSAVGLVIFGMATSESIRNDDQANLGLALLIGGFVVGILGVLWYRANEARADRG
jgi:membrane protein DedA with SNARE-associated domain